MRAKPQLSNDYVVFVLKRFVIKWQLKNFSGIFDFSRCVYTDKATVLLPVKKPMNHKSFCDVFDCFSLRLTTVNLQRVPLADFVLDSRHCHETMSGFKNCRASVQERNCKHRVWLPPPNMIEARTIYFHKKISFQKSFPS